MDRNEAVLAIKTKDGTTDFWAIKEVEKNFDTYTQVFTTMMGDKVWVDCGDDQVIKVEYGRSYEAERIDFFEGETLSYNTRPSKKSLFNSIDQWKKDKELELARGEDWGTFS